MSYKEKQNNIPNKSDNNAQCETVKKVKSFYYNRETLVTHENTDMQPAEKTAGKSHFFNNDIIEPSFYSDDFLKTDKQNFEPENTAANETESLNVNDTKKETQEQCTEKMLSDSADAILERNRSVLCSLKVSDIKIEKTVQKAKSGFLRKAALSFFSIVIVLASLNIVYELYLKNVASKYYDGIRESFYSNELSVQQVGYLSHDVPAVLEEKLYSDEGDIYKPSELEVVDAHTKFEKMLPNIVALKKINSGVFAWIKVEGTRVDYPVVKSPQGNNDYYLDHALDRTYNVSGSVFADYNNSTNLSKNRNTCVYGHNMNDGTMFQTIMNFKTKNQFDTGTIEMYTADGIHIYTPIAAYEAAPTEMFFHTQFQDDGHFQLFLNDITSKSIYPPPATPKVTDKIITLITCTNTFPDKRFVVHGVLKEIVK